MERSKEKNIQIFLVDPNSKAELAALLEQVAVRKLTEEARYASRGEE